ncbi:MAG: hypothetical protein L3J63_02870 [Geopsychrobacter sp.]|nr:hypothetical protein [Geopsychrobacter sp.]
MAREKLNRAQRAQLARITQAGLSHAAATLKQMLGGEIRIQVTEEPFRCAAVLIRLGLRGALPGELFIALPENLAQGLVKRLTAESDLSLLNERARSALMEFGNILASAFVGYYDQNHGLRTLPTPPEMSLVPLDIPTFDSSVCASFSWSTGQVRGDLLIGFEQPGLDILLVR